jgi:hypothetical protein
MWGEFFRRALQAGLAALPGAALGNHFAMLFWILRELVWWWLIAGLAAIVICHLTQLPLLRDGAAWLGRVWLAFGRTPTRLFRGITADR